jgi:hypothetical protein
MLAHAGMTIVCGGGGGGGGCWVVVIIVALLVVIIVVIVVVGVHVVIASLAMGAPTFLRLRGHEDVR